MSNLTVFKALAQEYPDVDFRAIYVGPGGTTRRVEEAALESDALVDVYIRGKHRGETITRLVARDFPNQNIPLLIKKLEVKHGINPSAVVYGPSRTLREAAEASSAGCVLLAEDTGRWGLQRRSANVDDSGTWACWGGGRNPGETLEQTVRRELAEESGYTGELTLIPLHKNSRYATYVGVVPHEFEPMINHESDDWCWRDFDSWPQPLHPGLAAVRDVMIQQPDLSIITDSELPDLGYQEPVRNWAASTSVDPDQKLQRASFSDLNTGLNLGISADQPGGLRDYQTQQGVNVGLGPVNANFGPRGSVSGGVNIPTGNNSNLNLSAFGNQNRGVQGLGAQLSQGDEKDGAWNIGVSKPLQGDPTFNVGYRKIYKESK
jgi:8-oxo-dGTP pyrophosphatase MutT (NUDIX family)